jgi:hypothetical protein
LRGRLCFWTDQAVQEFTFKVGSREGVLFGVPEVELRSSFRVQQPSVAE